MSDTPRLFTSPSVFPNSQRVQLLFLAGRGAPRGDIGGRPGHLAHRHRRASMGRRSGGRAVALVRALLNPCLRQPRRLKRGGLAGILRFVNTP